MDFVWTTEAKKNLTKLEKSEQIRIATKMRWFASQQDPLHFAKSLIGTDDLYRFRIGVFRVLVRPDGTVITVLRISKRSEAYR